MPISGALCESSMKWPSVFYFHAGASVLLFTCFSIFYRNSPRKFNKKYNHFLLYLFTLLYFLEKHPNVGDKEMAKIKVGKSNASKKELRSIPYLEILKTPSVWAVWIGAIGNFVCVNMMFLYSPLYMTNVLHMNAHSSGISSALPPLAQFCIKLLAGFTSDKIRCLTETNKLRMYNSIAFVGCGLLLLVLAFWPSDQTNFMLLLFGGSAGLLGFTTGGFFKAGPLVSKQYSHFVTGNISQGKKIFHIFCSLEMLQYTFCYKSKFVDFTIIFSFCYFRDYNYNVGCSFLGRRSGSWQYRGTMEVGLCCDFSGSSCYWLPFHHHVFGATCALDSVDYKEFSGFIYQWRWHQEREGYQRH